MRRILLLVCLLELGQLGVSGLGEEHTWKPKPRRCTEWMRAVGRCTGGSEPVKERPQPRRCTEYMQSIGRCTLGGGPVEKPNPQPRRCTEHMRAIGRCTGGGGVPVEKPQPRRCTEYMQSIGRCSTGGGVFEALFGDLFGPDSAKGKSGGTPADVPIELVPKPVNEEKPGKPYTNRIKRAPRGGRGRGPKGHKGNKGPNWVPPGQAKKAGKGGRGQGRPNKEMKDVRKAIRKETGTKVGGVSAADPTDVSLTGSGSPVVLPSQPNVKPVIEPAPGMVEIAGLGIIDLSGGWDGPVDVSIRKK